MDLKTVRMAAWLVLLGVLVFPGQTKADSVYVDGSYAFANNGEGIPPYGGTLNGHSAKFYCVDFADSIKGGMSWKVTVTSLTGSNFSSTFMQSQTPYLEMAWLITQMWSAPTETMQAEYQYAIWSLTGGPNPFGTNSSLIQQALAAVSTFNGQGWEILTPTGSTGQEFLIYTPEPPVLVLLVVGLLGLAIVSHKKLGV